MAVRSKVFSALTVLTLLLGSVGAHAALITPDSVTSFGPVNNSTNIITDGVIPGEGSVWNSSDKVWWTGTAAGLTLSLGQEYLIEDILVSVDNNDAYSIGYSTDGAVFHNLFNIQSYFGEIGYGMDTMSSDNTSSEYVSGIDFAPVNASFLRIAAIGGDRYYSVGEFQAFGSVVSNDLPEPASLALLGLGLAGLGVARRKRKTA